MVFLTVLIGLQLVYCLFLVRLWYDAGFPSHINPIFDALLNILSDVQAIEFSFLLNYFALCRYCDLANQFLKATFKLKHLNLLLANHVVQIVQVLVHILHEGWVKVPMSTLVIIFQFGRFHLYFFCQCTYVKASYGPQFFQHWTHHCKHIHQGLKPSFIISFL